MKNVLLFFAIVFFALFYRIQPVGAADALWNCTRSEVTVNLTGQWPGGSLYGSCPGDTGGSGCTGHVNKPITIANGAITTFDRCSCWNQPGNQACLNIPSNLPAGCTAQITGSYCGTNGDYLYPQINITCQPPATPCPGGVGYCGDANGNFTNSCPNGGTNWYSTADNWCANPSNNSNYDQANHCFQQCNRLLQPIHRFQPLPRLFHQLTLRLQQSPHFRLFRRMQLPHPVQLYLQARPQRLVPQLRRGQRQYQHWFHQQLQLPLPQTLPCRRQLLPRHQFQHQHLSRLTSLCAHVTDSSIQNP